MTHQTTIVDAKTGTIVTRDMTAEEEAEYASQIPQHWPVLKLTIRTRVKAAGLGAQLDAAFAQLSVDQQNDWNAAVFIWSDDPTVRGFLTQIGADPDTILAADPDAA